MRYTKLEQETIVNFNEAESFAQVYTFNKALQNRLNRLAADRPEECCIDPDERKTGRAYIVPKSWVTVRPPRRSAMTAEQREKARLSMLRINTERYAIA